MQRQIVIWMVLLIGLASPMVHAQWQSASNFHHFANCVLPVPAAIGIGTRFDATRAEYFLSKKLGPEQQEWFRIPDWFSGIWQIREGYATQRGLVKGSDLWWYFGSKPVSSHWVKEYDAMRQSATYIFRLKHEPVFTAKGLVNFRQTSICFRLNGDYNIGSNQSPPTVSDIWQEDSQEIFRKIPSGMLEHTSASQIYASNGRKIDEAPIPHSFVHGGGLTRTQTKLKAVPPGMPFKDTLLDDFRTRKDAFQDLRMFLWKRRLFDEMKAVEKNFNG